VLAALTLVLSAAAAAEPVTVRFPAGDCSTHRIEVQVFDRDARAWQPHPQHPQLDTGRCIRMDSGVLLNELRVRCVDPKGRLAPSGWIVGAEVFQAGDASDCPDAD
jgi:hypothetical protein